jgi:hypothetical protein
LRSIARYLTAALAYQSKCIKSITRLDISFTSVSHPNPTLRNYQHDPFIVKIARKLGWLG